MFYRFVIALWLCGAGALSGCSVYDGIFHPHRLGTPRMSQEAKTRARAAEKARHKGTSLQAGSDGEELADTNNSAPVPASPDKAAPAADADKTKSFKELPAGTRATYDKQGLLRRGALVRMQQNRRQLHHYDLSAPKPTEATRAARKLRTHPKGTKKPAAAPRELKEPKVPAEPASAPAPTQPAPAAKAPKPAKQKAAKLKKDPKAPKPDPTQPLPGAQ